MYALFVSYSLHPLDRSPPGSSVHGISQARILEWVAISYSKKLTKLSSLLAEKAMAPHSSTLAWKIPRTVEPGRLQSMRSHRVGQDWAASLSLFTFMHWEGHGNPLQCSCLENPRDSRAWWAAVNGVAQSRTRLKRLGSSSSMYALIT